MFGLNEALMSFIRRQVGLRTDTADPAGSLHAKLADLKATLTYMPRKIYSTATVQVQQTDTRSGTTGDTYTMDRSIQVLNTGQLNVKCDFYCGSRNPRMKLYINGVEVSSDQTGNPSTWYTYSSPVLGVRAGDTIEIWTRGSGGVATQTRKFKICYDFTTANDLTVL